MSKQITALLSFFLLFNITADAQNNAAIMARKQVPIVCYHQIRDWRPKDSKNAKDYIVQIAAFKEHIKMLADSGYHTILPDQYMPI